MATKALKVDGSKWTLAVSDTMTIALTTPTYNSKKRVDIRAYFLHKGSGEVRPMKKGVSIPRSKTAINGLIKALEAVRPK